MIRKLLTAAAVLCAVAFPAAAHDAWLQTNSAVVRTGDVVHIDLLLGNHGNDHRDFKIAGKLAPETLERVEVVAPDGKRWDLKPDLVDLGYAPKEGFHSARFTTARPGLYVAALTADRVVKHGRTVRSIRSAKTFFLASDSLDKVSHAQPGFDKPLGHPIELVPEANPVAPMGPGTPIKVKLLFEGKPLAGVKVSFIPRGVTLREGIDSEYERQTDAGGRAAFTPKVGTYYLIVAHYPREEKGQGYESILYSATLSVLVPQKCACCDE